MEKVVIAIYEGIYPNLLAESLLKNPGCKVEKMVKSDRLVGTKSFFASLAFFLRKTSVLFLLPKMFEVFLFYYGSIFVSKKKRAYKTLKELSKEFQVPLETTSDINAYFENETGGDKILFSISYYQKFSAGTLARFKKAYNIHPAPLPKGAGLFPSFWLLLHPLKDGRYFQTVHEMTADIDKGPIIEQLSAEKPDNINSSTHYMTEATKLGCRMLERFDFNKVTQKGYAAKKQSGEGSYYAYPKTKDVLNFWKTRNSFFRGKDIKNLLFKAGGG